MTETDRGAASTRATIIEAAARLLREGGPARMTTRRVAELAAVQAPTIYRLFGDKDGLLEAVAEHVMTGFVADKAADLEAVAATNADPVHDLRDSWSRQIQFGLDNPAVFRLLSDPARVQGSVAARTGKAILASRVHRLAEAGCLGVSEARAVHLIQAAGIGTIQTCLATPADQRDPGLGDAMLEAVLDAILTKTPDDGAPEPSRRPMTAAVSLRALAPHLDALTPSERHLLVEWLDRVVDAHD